MPAVNHIKHRSLFLLHLKVDMVNEQLTGTLKESFFFLIPTTKGKYTLCTFWPLFRVFSCFHVLLVVYYSRIFFSSFLVKLYNLQKHENKKTLNYGQKVHCVLALRAVFCTLGNIYFSPDLNYTLCDGLNRST
jgi:hypothetical protein